MPIINALQNGPFYKVSEYMLQNLETHNRGCMFIVFLDCGAFLSDKVEQEDVGNLHPVKLKGSISINCCILSDFLYPSVTVGSDDPPPPQFFRHPLAGND